MIIKAYKQSLENPKSVAEAKAYLPKKEILSQWLSDDDQCVVAQTNIIDAKTIIAIENLAQEHMKIINKL